MEGKGLVKYDNAMYARAAALCGKHAASFAAASVEYGVPVELLMACALTEGAPKNPETCVRKEPGYIEEKDGKKLTETEADNLSPARISAGMCQLLISTARGIMKDPKIDRAWLLNPLNSIRACAAYIKSNHDRQATDWDPIYVACAYNAGGLYENKGEGKPVAISPASINNG